MPAVTDRSMQGLHGSDLAGSCDTVDCSRVIVGSGSSQSCTAVTVGLLNATRPQQEALDVVSFATAFVLVRYS